MVNYDYQDIIIISKNSKFIFRSVLFVSILNLILNYILITYFGINGAACAFIISLTTFALLLLWKSIKILECSFSDLFDIPLIGKIVSLAVVLSAIIYFVNMLFCNSVWFIIFSAPFYFLFILLGGFKFNLIPDSLANYLKNKFKVLNRI